MPLIDLIDKLQQSLPSGTVLTGEPMARHTTFRVGGPADVMVLADSGADIQKTVALCREENYPFIILGNGSNVLVRDGGIRGCVIPVSYTHLDVYKRQVAATIANDGIMMEPKLVKSIINARGYEYNKITPKTLKTVMSPENAQVIREYMISAVTDGLGGRAAVSGYTVGGKTGSAEVSDDKSVPTHAWYNGFIYDDKSPLAIAVIVEHGGSEMCIRDRYRISFPAFR